MAKHRKGRPSTAPRLPNTGEKWCPRCKTMKIKAVDFSRGSPYCKPCMVDYNKERGTRWKNKVMDKLGGECSRCGIADRRVLHVHHEDPNPGKQHKPWSWSKWKKIYEDDTPGAYILFCLNCHHLHHTE